MRAGSVRRAILLPQRFSAASCSGGGDQGTYGIAVAEHWSAADIDRIALHTSEGLAAAQRKLPRISRGKGRTIAI